jgi:aldehyde dehydrogenase (NAD+)
VTASTGRETDRSASPWVGQFDKVFIGGEWVTPDGSKLVDVLSPATEEVVASVPDASRSDIDRAVRAARKAFETGAWPRMTVEERIATLRKVRDALDENREMVARLVTKEMGAPITQSRAVQARMPVVLADMNLEVAAAFPFESTRSGFGGHALVTMEPVGVVAAIIPWNGPVAQCILKLFPALLAGCTVVLKPSLETPMGAYFVADLMARAGLPEGVLSVLPAGADSSEFLATHPEVDLVTFTGSTSVGRRIAELCGKDLRRVHLELGGKSPAVILDDADLDLVSTALRMGSLRNSGQVCSLKTRILVSEHREAEVIDRLTTMMHSMEVGDPFEESSEIGPMISGVQQQRVAQYQEIGAAEGATTVLGGRGTHPDFDRGFYVDPTLFTRVAPNMRIAQEEVFGPVISVLTYRDEEEAVRIANFSEYGLSGSVFSTDFEHALAVARKIRSGTVEINGAPTGPLAPAGGFKASGIGREYGPEGLSAYLEPRSIGLPEEARSWGTTPAAPRTPL